MSRRFEMTRELWPEFFEHCAELKRSGKWREIPMGLLGVVNTNYGYILDIHDPRERNAFYLWTQEKQEALDAEDAR